MAAVVHKDLDALRKALRARETVDIAKCVKLVNSLKVCLVSMSVCEMCLRMADVC